MLSTCVTEFPLRNVSDDAAEHGPRYNDGGNTSETDSCCLPIGVIRMNGLFIKLICRQIMVFETRQDGT